MVNNQPHSFEAIEHISRSMIGFRGKLGYVAPPDVIDKMSKSARTTNTHIIGLDISNQIFQDLYPEAEFIGYFGHGYDFIMPDGTKTDVKAATINKSGRWHFAIGKNKIPDSFFLMIFDDNNNYNLLRMWNIPAHNINHLTGVSISDATMYKWNDYVVPIKF